jgi:hypothetical protein
LKVIRMSSAAFARLEGAVATYLWQTLSRAFPAEIFTLGTALITEHARAILALPNRTPNGVVLARRETFHSFNMVHQALADAVEAAGILSSFSLFQLPCNVRVISGAADPQADKRSYASAKMHTDVWNGEPTSSILFNIPVLGDTQGVDLRFFEPTEFPENLRSLLRDYTLGREVAESAEEYPAVFEMGRMYVSDALSLHQTVKRRPTLRVSLDFRTIARELLPGESFEHGDSRAVYVASEAWRAGGSTTIIGSGEPLDAFQRRQSGEIVTRDALSIVNVDDFPVGR